MARVEEAVPLPAELEAEPEIEADGWNEADKLAEYRAKLEQWRPRQETYVRERYRAEQARSVEIDIVEEGGFQRTLTSIDDLESLPPDEVDRIEILDIDIGGKGYSPTSASINLSSGKGLEVRIAGSNRLWTSGLRHEVEEILMPRGRLRPPLLGDDDVVMAAAVATTFVLFFALALVFRKVGRWAVGTSLGAGFGIALLVGVLIGAIAALPYMEILAPGLQPRYQRWRRGIAATALTLALGIAGSVIAAVITSGSHSHQRARSSLHR